MCKFPWKCYPYNPSDRLSSIALTFILITLHIRHSKDFNMLAYLASFYENRNCFCLMNTCNMFILEYTAHKLGVWEIFSKLFFNGLNFFLFGFSVYVFNLLFLEKTCHEVTHMQQYSNSNLWENELLQTEDSFFIHYFI